MRVFPKIFKLLIHCWLHSAEVAVQNAQLRVGNVDSFPRGSDRGMPGLVENPTARR